MLCAIIGLLAAGMIEFYKNVIDGADQAINGQYQPVHMHQAPKKP